MYRHSITIYDKRGRLLAKIRDAVDLRKFGHTSYFPGEYLGGPVEAAFTADGDYLWVSNYNMEGKGFKHPGCDGCHGSEFDPGFLYKINVSTFEIENVVKVGAVPKFLAISNDQQTLLVSNWSSGDVSVVDLKKEVEVERIKVGVHPRGIDITEDGKQAFVTVMGSNKIAVIDLQDYSVDYLENFGRSPRHLILGSHDSVLYVSLNSGNQVVRYNRFTKEKLTCKTPPGPRSMCISPDESYLYVVNYFDNTFSKIDCRGMELLEVVATAEKPIGICGNWEDAEIWVACYSGKIEIFKDIELEKLQADKSFFNLDWSSYFSTSEIKEEVVIPEVEEMKPSDSLMGNSVLPAVTLREKTERPITKTFYQKSKDCHYHLIAGSFSVPENADKKKEELKLKGYSAEVIVGKLNYVSVNCYGSREEAESHLDDIKKQLNESIWILKR